MASRHTSLSAPTHHDSQGQMQHQETAQTKSRANKGKERKLQSLRQVHQMEHRNETQNSF